MKLCDNEDPIVVGVMVLMPQQCSACGEAVCSTRMCSHFSNTCFWQCVAIGLFYSVVGVMTVMHACSLRDSRQAMYGLSCSGRFASGLIDT